MGPVQTYLSIYEQNLRRKARKKYFQTPEREKLGTNEKLVSQPLTQEQIDSIEQLVAGERLLVRRRVLLFFLLIILCTGLVWFLIAG